MFDFCKVYPVKVAQSCPTLCNLMDYTVHGILQARILEWVVFPFSRGSSQPRDQTQVSWIAGGLLPSCATREITHIWQVVGNRRENVRFDPIENPHQLRRIFLMSAALHFSKGAKKGASLVAQR